MLYVTHDQIEALTMGDRVAVLRDGVLQQVAPPEEIYQRPANRFVASFIGSPAMNLLPAAADGRLLRVGAFLLERPLASHALNGQRLELGIRPEHLRVSLDGPGVPAEVQVSRWPGASLPAPRGRWPAAVARVGLELRPPSASQVRVEIPVRQHTCSTPSPARPWSRRHDRLPERWSLASCWPPIWWA